MKRCDSNVSRPYCCEKGWMDLWKIFCALQENYTPLHQNGILVFLRRPLEELSSAGRPLSQSVGVEALYEKRLPLYEAWADALVDILEDPNKTAAAILAAVKITKEEAGGSI